MDAESWLVGRYELRRQIGAGGTGQVWTAHDAVLGREVAIKVQQADPDEDHAAFERFVREARSAAALQHPNVVTIFDTGIDGDTAFLVMELLPGPTLTGYLAQHGPLAEREAVALSAQVASGLAAAHGAGVVHRDIKPANLMFDARGTLKIVDFGIARLTQTVATRLTARDAVIGSPPYLSPEQLQGQRADERSDIYCLGGVMMTMLTGRAPFEGTHPLALMQQHLNSAPPQVSDRRPGIDPALNAIVAQMLSKSPQDRPQSAVELLDRLTGSTHEVPIGAATAAPLVDIGQTVQPSPTHPYLRAESTARPRQRSLLGLGILAGVAVVALVTALVIGLVTTAESPTARRFEPAPATRTPSVATTRSSEPSPRAAEPTAAEPTAAEPSAAKPTTAAAPTRRPATTQAAPPTTDTGSDERDLDQALSSLQASAGEVSRGGQIDPKKANELGKRVDGLTQQLQKQRGAEATKKVDELEKYLAGLAKKGELTSDGQQRIATALSGIREVVAQG